MNRLQIKLKEFFYHLAMDKKPVFWLFPFKIFLGLLSLFYFILLKFITFFCGKKEKFVTKIISVGNITWGGTGKTPLVINIAKYFKQKHSVAIVTRGYGREKRTGMPADEVILLSQRLSNIPVIVTDKRKKGIERAIREYGAEIVILDDGFQQWEIKKDLEIVVIDGLNPFGNGWLLPRGILREPVASLKRADLFVINKVDLLKDGTSLYKLRERLKKINPKAPIFEAIYSPRCLRNLIDRRKESLDILKEKDVCIFSGIASPDSFKSTVEKLGCKLRLVFEFLDHYPYRETDLIKLCAMCLREKISILVTTEKDAVRLVNFVEQISKQFPSLSIFSLEVELKLLSAAEFYERLSLISNG
ncbi:MAG: tetraacyldisaccharide 4'-kinase [Candidatus Omnitrophica bacterium]|nr:tetraacyldisaccharide 4'-kinase [Candidatus Omnitrophota bacterium]